MHEAVRIFLRNHPTKARWLDDIIDVLLRSGGKAHVRAISRELSKVNERDINAIEQTVTRCINDFCSDAQDYQKDKRCDLFARVNPATYRLRSYPERPDVIELIRIEFIDSTMHEMWKEFAKNTKSRFSDKWNAATNAKKLGWFVRQMSKRGWLDEYERRKAVVASMPEITLADLEGFLIVGDKKAQDIDGRKGRYETM
jgi:hypothetical protein